ncbi:poly(A) polymerase [Plantactinospora sonchi]|uniref:Poly(A) polymerase n=1 Tax=Plantactinospora sonchi TaxID=1544735 RepID=A0ABU7RU19_9ACTN
MRTSAQIYHRVRWDPRFDPSRFVLGVNVHGADPARVPLPAFVPGGDIPWHRVLFIEADGEVVWDRAAGLDRVDVSPAGRVQDPRRLAAPFFTAATPHAWDPLVAAWRPAPQPEAEHSPAGRTSARLRVLTWNTLWDRYDSDRIDTARRRPLLLAALHRADADVIGLQEVEPALLDLLLEADWVRSGYTLGGDPTGADITDTGLLLLTRLPVREAGRHPLGPHKAVAALVVDGPAGPLVVAGTHLTSDHTDNGAQRREVELAQLHQLLGAVDGPVLLLGDFNDGGGTPTERLPVTDAWSEVYGRDDDTPTFDPRANPLAAVSSRSGRPGRLDRVLLRGAALRPVDAVLLGDVPATPDGLFVSDHYGVAVDVAVDHDAGVSGADGPGDSVVDLAPTARTALAWIPPQECWPAIQEIRRDHDPQVDRWPPHVNLLFGFVAESAFETVAAALCRVAAATEPFPVRLAGVRTFAHRDGTTVWLDPAADGTAPWLRLRHALERAFPGCRGRLGEYVPHLTLGRVTDPRRLVADFATRLAANPAYVGDLVLLSRRGAGPMRPRATIALGSGRLRWCDDVDPSDSARPLGATVLVGSGAAVADGVRSPSPIVGERHRIVLARQVATRLRAALPDTVVHVVGSRRLGCALPGADLDLLVASAGAVDLATVRARIGATLPAATGLRPVVGARVPGLRFTVGDLDVDVAVVSTGDVPPAEAVTRRAELGESAAVALSAVSDAEALRAAVAANRPSFIRLARQIKAWAHARGLDSAPFGGLPGLAWTVLAARTLRDAGDVDPRTLLGRFFADWAAWDWRHPVALYPTAAGVTGAGPLVDVHPTGPAVRILTPSAPVRYCSDQVGVGGRDLLTRELYAGWEIVESTGPDGLWPALLAPPPMHRRHAAWAVLTVRAVRTEAYEVTLGRVRGRLRALLSVLDRAGVPEVHAWPRPFETGPGLTRFAIGLGPVPPDVGRLAALGRPWLTDLPGVALDRLPGGDLPTLR